MLGAPETLKSGPHHSHYRDRPEEALGRGRNVIEDFELHGKRIPKGSVVMLSVLYAKACDPRVSAGDHADVALPLHMDIHQLHASFRPERWLAPVSELDMAVRPWHARLNVLEKPVVESTRACCGYLAACPLTFSTKSFL